MSSPLDESPEAASADQAGKAIYDQQTREALEKNERNFDKTLDQAMESIRNLLPQREGHLGKGKPLPEKAPKTPEKEQVQNKAPEKNTPEKERPTVSLRKETHLEQVMRVYRAGLPPQAQERDQAAGRDIPPGPPWLASERRQQPRTGDGRSQERGGPERW